MTTVLWFAVVAAAWTALTRVPFSWVWLQPEPCRITNCYCEEFRPGSFVLQPITALSNLGYVLAGLVIAVRNRENITSWRKPEHFTLAHIRFSRQFGTGLILAGFFSFLSHASLSRAGEWLDLMGVYLLGGLLAVYNLGRLAGTGNRRQLWILAAALLLGGVQMALAPQFQTIGIALFFGSTLSLEIAVQIARKPRGNRILLLAALALYAAGGMIWIAGRGAACAATFPWHAGWHLLSAAAAWLLFKYYQSETSIS